MCEFQDAIDEAISALKPYADDLDDFVIVTINGISVDITEQVKGRSGFDLSFLDD